MSEHHHNGDLVIIGSGPSGLKTAMAAIENGQDPHKIHIVEASNRDGGKIKTGYLADGTPANEGAEFVDSNHAHVIETCNKLGVALKPSTEQGSELFQRPDGSVMAGDDFHAAYEPLAAQIRADKAAVLADPQGATAQRINNMSMNEYLAQLRASIPAVANPGIFQRLGNFFTGKQNLVDPAITNMAMQAFASEVGQPPEKVNALQYLHEASAEAGSFLDSDCAYRVEGGTENMIIAMKKHLVEKGVKFTYNAPVSKAEPAKDGVLLHVAGHEPIHASHVISAIPTYALAKIEGLEHLGMSQAAKDLITNTQYTNSVKFTVKTKPGVVAPKDNFFSNHGFQVWSAGEGQMTFLVNADKLEKMKAPEMIRAVMGSYATSMGSTADALFDTSPGNIVYTNPGKNPCYASPAPGQARQLELLGKELEKMQAHGFGVVGTFLPHQTENGIELGFMECGMASAEHVVGQMLPKQQHRTQWVDKVVNKDHHKAHAPAHNDNDSLPHPATQHSHIQAVNDNRASDAVIGR